MFKLVKKGDLSYYIIEEFEETGLLHHCFTTRLGGVSEGPYESMNLRFNCDDKRENVIRNHQIICSALGVDYRALVISKQVHEDNIIKVGKKHRGNGIIRENEFTSADGLMTNENRVPLLTVYADCVPVMLLDPVKKAIASVHSGWRGTVSEISKKAVEKMHSEYGSRADDIIAAIGPSISEKNFEVGDEVAELFIGKFGAETAVKYGEKYHVNMQKAIAMQLVGSGVTEKNIIMADICTYDNPQLFFSHRKTNGIRGNMAAVMELV